MLATTAAAVVVGADVRLQGGIGDREVAVASPEAAARASRVAIGTLTVDLAKLGRQKGRLTHRASVGVGDLKIIVPNRVRVDLEARVGRGQIDASPGYVSGSDQTLVDEDPWLGPRRNPKTGRGSTELRVLADVGIGNIEVVRSYASAEYF